MLTLARITKSFGSNRAVDGVSLQVRRGEIVAIVGENGAGKTTLMRIAAGELAPDSGTTQLDGRAELVHQHFMLVSNFTIAENIAIALSRGEVARVSAVGRPLIRSRRTVERDAEAIIASSGLELRDVARLVAELSVGERSKLELIKAIAKRPEILILDEPTSVLTPSETATLFGVMRQLAVAGTAILFISHKLREVLAIAERVVVMRGGRVVAEAAAGATTAEQLAHAMVGERALGSATAEAIGALQREAATTAAPNPEPSDRPPALRCEKVSGERLDEVTFEVAAGEIVAIVGVAGNGQAELAAVLRGIAAARSGRIALGGREVTRRDLRRSREVGHVPEDRTRNGLVAPMSIAENIALTARRWHPRQARRLAARLIEIYSIRAQSPAQPAGSLSGGNQQKVILARELDRRPACIVAAEPTRGLDIAAIEFVHQQLRLAAAAGSGILLITSDLDEAFALAGAMHVIYSGRLSARLAPTDAAAQVANLMAGVA